MADFDKLVENFFNKKENVLELNELNKIIEKFSKEKIIESNTKTETVKEISQQDIIKLLPKFEFNERAIGKVDTEDRKQFELFIGQKIKSATSVQDKIKILNDFCNIKKDFKNTKDILSNLTILKILKNIVTQSSPGSSGYQFEAFIAALFGGEQISDDSAVDVTIGNKLYQIKLLAEKGSARVARSNIEKIKGQQLNFIIVNKTSNNEELQFYVLEDIKAEISDEKKKEFRINSSEYINHKVGTVKISDEVFNHYSLKLKDNVLTVLTQTTVMINNINKLFYNNDTQAGRAGASNATNISVNLNEQVNK